MVRHAAIGAVLAMLVGGCRCSFDSSTLDDLACSTASDCAPGQDCIEDTCAQRGCTVAADCGPGYSFVCDESGFCVAAGCSAPEDCGAGFVCEDGFCRAGTAGDGGLPDASLPDGGLPDASLPDAGPDASVGCQVDGQCDDGVFCNGAETCVGGQCRDGTAPCPATGPCREVLCDEVEAVCQIDQHPDGSECDDGNACTHGDGCAGGECTSTPYSCDDGVACTADVCDGLGGCSNTLQAGFCTIGGACQSAGEADPNDGCSVCDPDVGIADWTLDCGICATACGPLEQCLARHCAPAPYGNAADGDLAVALGETVTLSVPRSAVDGVGGTTSLDLANADGFAAGQVLLVHQSQGAGAGVWELVRIFELAGNVATLSTSLLHDYSSEGGNRAQAIVVPQYLDVTVDGTLTAPAWDGATGGILAVAASGTARVDGAIDMAGRGFRGTGHDCVYQCATGYAGESADGPGAVQQTANGGGGGAGTSGQDCGMGGGGGYGTAGGTGANGINGFGACGGAVPLGGIGGSEDGAADLDVEMLFGGAGGEGGADEDGARPGPGGNGGGIVVVLASVLTVSGTIDTSGLVGGDGDSIDCGGLGCGMGGGGGGAGGGIRIVAGTADLGNQLVRSLGGPSGQCTCGGQALTGAGGVGRIHVSAGVLAGTTNPP